jgi:hypothetical protein
MQMAYFTLFVLWNGIQGLDNECDGGITHDRLQLIMKLAHVLHTRSDKIVF